MKKYSLFLLVMTIASMQLFAIDSLKIYKLGEVNVLPDSEYNIFSPLNTKTSYQQIQNTDPTSIENLKILLPSVEFQTNSRGETIFTYRGSQERQTNFYLDGALLSIPWDSRTDLGILNPNIIGKIEFSPITTLYGPNNMMGIVSLNSFERISDGFGGTARIMMGDANTKNLALTHDGRIGKFNYIAAANWLNSDGKIASHDVPTDLYNYNYDSQLIPNSYSNQLNFYAKGEYRFSKLFAAGISVNHSTYDKGVIPEENKKPEKVRFWQYPDNSRLLLTLNTDIHTDAQGKNMIKLTYWFDDFLQNIDSYEDMTYSSLKDGENNEDLTNGFRIINNYSFSDHNSLAVAVNGLATTHDETIIAYADDTAKSTANTEFSQNLFSMGAEYKHILGNCFEVKIGGEYDYSKILKAGLFTEADGKTDNGWGAIAGLNYLIVPEHTAFLNFSRKTRFPGLREAYSAALGKFKVNLDLSPETNMLFELGYVFNIPNFYLKTTAFANLYDNMIIKTTDSTTQLEMRANIGSASIYGVEIIANYSFLKYCNINANLTYMYSEGKDEKINVEHLDYRPVLAGGLTAAFKTSIGLSGQAEVDYIGTQYAHAGNNQFDEIAPTCLLNLRLSYSFMLYNSILELYVRANNVFDTYREVKLGIPDAGRMFSSGILFRI